MAPSLSMDLPTKFLYQWRMCIVYKNFRRPQPDPILSFLQYIRYVLTKKRLRRRLAPPIGNPGSAPAYLIFFFYFFLSENLFHCPYLCILKFNLVVLGMKCSAGVQLCECEFCLYCKSRDLPRPKPCLLAYEMS